MPGARTTDGGQPVVLVVEDDEELLELNARRLQGEYEVLMARNGEAALEKMSDAVDVVVLDRRMPGLSGDELLDAIRSRGYECRVTMLTGVDPDYDIIDMGFDDYLIKPVTRDELLSTVDALIARSAYDDAIQEYFALAAKRASLEVTKSESELQESNEFDELTDRVEAVRTEADEIVTDLEDESVERLFEKV
jgi:two-component system response regulator AdeR